MVYVGGRPVAAVTQGEVADSVAPRDVKYLNQDPLGSIQAITNSDGTLSSTRNFGPFGLDPQPLTDASAVPFGYTGQEQDPEFGLVNMHGRMYDPALGQFMAPDPVLQQPYSQGLNRFAYVFNSPLNHTDPSGFVANKTDIGLDIGIGIGYFSGLVATVWQNSSSAEGVASAVTTTASVATATAAPSVTGAIGAVPALGIGASAGLAVFNTALLTGRQPVSKTTDLSKSSSSVASGPGTPSAGQTASNAVAPVQETSNENARFRQGSGQDGAAPTNPQARIDSEYKVLGLNYGRPPRYDPRLPDFGSTNPDSGVTIGNLAVNGSTSVLRSTLIHEATHVQQIGARNYAKHGIAGNVNEIEAYREELLNADTTGLSLSEQRQVGFYYRDKLDNLFNEGPVGMYYARQILLYDNFALRSQDVLLDPIPDWWPTP